MYAHLARFPSKHPSELGVWDQQGQEKSRVGETGGGERAGPGSDLVRVDPHTHAALGLQLLCWVTGLNTRKKSRVELGTGSWLGLKGQVHPIGSFPIWSWSLPTPAF